MDRRHSIIVSGLLIAIAALSALPGCGSGSSQSADSNALTGVEWTLVGSSLSSLDLSVAGITATFDGTQMSGFSGVNQYSGPYTAGGDGSFKAGPFAGTMMEGPRPLRVAEKAYLSLIPQCTAYSISDGILTLSVGPQPTLIYKQAEAVQLPGTKWSVTGYNNGKQAVTSVAKGAELTIDFGTDGTASGNGGVNTYSGPFTVDGAQLKIGPLAATMMAGPEKLMTQETQFLTALQNAKEWSVVSGRLELRDSEGAIQVTAEARQ